jgi:hypothetical protein
MNSAKCAPPVIGSETTWSHPQIRMQPARGLELRQGSSP